MRRFTLSATTGEKTSVFITSQGPLPILYAGANEHRAVSLLTQRPPDLLGAMRISKC